MTNEQVYIIVGTSMLFNAVLFGLLMAYLNVKFEVSVADGVAPMEAE